jgi:hypothetical protein
MARYDVCVGEQDQRESLQEARRRIIYISVHLALQQLIV